MPNLDGLESTRIIRNLGFSAPIVALTAFSDEGNMMKCLDAGMNHFLPKPVRGPALRQVLKKFRRSGSLDDLSEIDPRSSPNSSSTSSSGT